MDYILSIVAVYFLVLTAGQSADLSIGVSYTSLQGDHVSYQLLHGDTRDVQLSTNDVTLSCRYGNFSLAPAKFENHAFYERTNESTFLIHTVIFSIGAFMGDLVCSNASYNLTAGLGYSGFGLVLSLPGTDPVGFYPGSAVPIPQGVSSGFILCLTSGDLNSNNNFPSLYWPNGTQFQLYTSVSAAGNPTHTFGAKSIAGLQLRLKNFSEAGEYRCVTLDSDDTPINITFVLFINPTDPCDLTVCPLYSQCNSTATKNLCQCQYQFLEYSNSRCLCPEGYALNGTNPPDSCEDINECHATPPVCSHLGHNATCTNTDGSYSCACQPNHTVVNGVCVHSCDILNCAQHGNRMCQWNGNQSFTCECLNGYSPILNSSACSLATVSSSSSISTVYSSSLIATVSSSSLIATVSSSSTTVTTMEPTVSSSTLLQNEIEAKLNNTTSLTGEETDGILADLNSSLSDPSVAASNFASAAALIKQVTQLINNITEEQLEDLLSILSSVANLPVLTDIQNDINTNTPSVSDVVSDIVESVENIAQLLAPLFYSKQNKTVFDNGNIRLEVEGLSLDKGTILFGENSTAEFSLRSLLYSSFVCKHGQNCTGNITDCETVGVSIQIKNVNRFMTANVSDILVFDSWFCVDVEENVLNSSGIILSANTDLFSFSLASVLCNISTSNLSEPIRFNFRLENTNMVDPSCVSLAPGPGGLTPNTSSCSQVASSSADTVSCSCNHLTSFSILMSPDTTYEYSFEMGVFTYVGLSVSILSLIIALFIFTFIRFKVSLAIFFVHYNLMVTVLLSEIVFIVGIDRSEIHVLCVIVASVLHYILLVSFCWMFFEIFNLLILIFRPRVNQKMIIHLYWLIAYGAPLIVVAATLGISRCNYGNYKGVSYPTPMSTNCWLPRKDGTYWAFIGPALFIILLNSLMLVILIVKLIHIKWAGKSYRASSLRKSTSNILAEGFLSAIRATVLLLPIIGFTWIFGVFAINSGETVSLMFQWLFLLFNCLQGFFIFLFYCVFKTEVRDAVLLLVLRKVFRREIRLAEGESLFSTMGISRKQSHGTDRNTLDRSLTTADSPFKSYKEDISLVSVSPAKTHATQSVGAKTQSSQVAFANPTTISTKDL